MRHIVVAIALVLMTGAQMTGAQSQIVGHWYGDISDGNCRCKDQCESSQSIFSEGRSVGQCKRMCQRAFSGCTKGEVRSYERRD
jgi:hypothetical protein